MEKRALGRTGLSISVLGFGCGSTGGLMVRGAPGDQERTVARAIDLGVNYFDTAAMYGDGASETNLGRVLSTLRRDVIVASKTSAEPDGPGSIAKAIFASAEASLLRLRRERIDVFQLHTPVTTGGAGALDVNMVIEEVIPAFETLRQQGKIGFFGFSGTGDPAALPQLIDTGAFASAQVIYSLLNSSAAGSKLGAVGPDFENVLGALSNAGMGAVAIRVLAAGALSSIGERHPVASPEAFPMGTNADYRSDVALARSLLPLVHEGHVATLVEAAIRFAISHPAVSTALVGFSDADQLEEAAGVINKGPLPPATLERIGVLLPRSLG
jgi:aryl-alcohol dehydrogenase-like predicted oxidoreductase